MVIPPDIIYEETSGDMMVPEGGSAKLVCKSRGFPKPKITWKREDGREIIARNGPHGKTKCKIQDYTLNSLYLINILYLILYSQPFLWKVKCYP